MNQDIAKKVQSWLQPPFDTKTQAEVKELQKDAKALEDSFYKDLEFGTGGLRGLMGVGTNRINRYTIGMATQGFAAHLINKYGPVNKVSVAVGYDTRNNSQYFARIVAEVFAANEIHVFLFEDISPTPLLSFAVRHLNCQGGVMITASHNPKEYNGYKAYNEQGAQFVAPEDGQVIEEVRKVLFDKIKFQAQKEYLHTVPQEVEKAYFQVMEKYHYIKGTSDLKIVFTPIHGTGVRLVPALLAKFGFLNVNVLEAQKASDGNFPTVVYPNPEEKETMALALEEAEKTQADIVFGTDPDADRLAVGVRNHKNEIVILNGNQTAVLAFHYLLEKMKNQGVFKEGYSYFVAKTIVTTDLIKPIADAFQVECKETLTGFKFIAELIHKTYDEFLIGAEESFGLMIGEDVRDKDSISAIGLMAQAAWEAKQKGKNLWSILLDLYVQFGFYQESLLTLTRAGKEGAQEIQNMMNTLRNNPPNKIDGQQVSILKDYLKSSALDCTTGVHSPLSGFPKSDVLQFILKDGSLISIRPSGTEPKIKFYFSVQTDLTNPSEYDEKHALLCEKMKGLKGYFNDFI